MAPTPPANSSGRFSAGIVSVMGLILVWGIVWANLPSKDELLSAQPPARSASGPPPVPELDLSIPGVPPASSTGGGSPPEPVRSDIVMGSPAAAETGGGRARHIAELKCEAEVEQVCPESLGGDARRRCVAQRLRHFPVPCRQILRQRIVRWKEAEGAIPACADDVKRFCSTVTPGEGRILQCLQEHAQDISERCYQNLPKGHLLVRH
jgi:hypothetical protein